jgi:hypothetical protein
VHVEHHTNEANLCDLLNVLPVVVNEGYCSNHLADIALLSTNSITIGVSMMNAREYARKMLVKPLAGNGF